MRPWHDYRCFGPFCFFDVHEGTESQPSGSGSWINVDEVDFVLLLYHKLVTRYPELKSSSRLAIISPYRYQVKLFRERFRETFGVESDKVVDVNTVDGFQVNGFRVSLVKIQFMHLFFFNHVFKFNFCQMLVVILLKLLLELIPSWILIH